MSRTVIARAPVRVSFGGGGTDLAAYYTRFGGFVVSTAIARYAYVLASDPGDGSISITSADYGTWETFEPGEIPEPNGTLALPRAAIEWFAQRGLRERGIHLFLASEVPPGTGLGSSSAMAVALVRAISEYLGITTDPGDLAELASYLEIGRLGMPIGKQDQYASAFGGLNAITFKKGGVEVAPLGLPAAQVDALDARLLLFSTGKSRDSSSILRGQQRDTTARPLVTESLHRIKALGQDMRTALMEGDLDAFGRFLHRAWEHKKRLSGRVSSSAIDRCYDSARRAGALGGKITGAGGGGFLLLYCTPERQDGVRSALGSLGLHELPFTFDLTGASLIAPTALEDTSIGSNVVSEHMLSTWRARRQGAAAPARAVTRKTQEDASHA